MKSNILLLVVVCSLLAGSANLMAKERRGAEIVIYRVNVPRLTGELIAVKQASLLLLDSQSGADVSVSMKEIDSLEIMKKSKTFLGAGLGFLSGVAIGGLGGLATYQIIWGEIAPHDEESRYRYAAVGAALCGLVGALVGGKIGEKAGRAETIQIAGEPPERIIRVLERLRSMARIKNYQ